MIKKLK